MSDLFPDDPVAVQSRREAVQRNFEAGPEPMGFWGASYDVLINGPRRGLYAVDEGLSRFGSVLANIPNTAFETPSYFRQTEAAHRITDPSSYEKTALSRWFDEQAEVDRRAIRRLTPDPRRVSEAQRTLSGLTQMLTMGFIGAPLGPAGPALTLGAGFGAESYHEQLDAGVDEDTATQIGIQQAAFGAAMGALPAAVPVRGGRFALWPALARAGSGATINVGVGMAMRQSLGDHLRRAGYGEQAERYRALDGQALVMDAVLGAVFGAFLSHADGTDKSASARSAPPDTARSATPPREPREPDWYYEEARQLATDEDLEAAYAHGLIARELGHPEAQGLLDLIAEEGGESVVQDGQALASIIGVRDGLIEPTQEHIDAALTLQADRQARVDSAPGVPLNLEAEARHGESLARAERQIADGEEVDVAGLWADQDGSDYAPHPVDYESEAVLEEAVRQVLEEGGYAHLARDVEAARARIRAMGGEIGPDEALFSFGARPRGAGVERGNEAFHDERLSPQENKAVEMARNNYSNAEIADELDFNSVNQVSVVLAHAAEKLGGVVWGRSRSGAPGQFRGEATATIEEIIALRNYLRTRGYRNFKGPAPLGTRSINQIIAERLHISPKSVAVRISKYERDVREGRREPLFSVAETRGFSTPEALRAEAEAEFGPAWTALERAGKVEVVQNSGDVPTEGFADLPRGVAAVHLRSRGATYFVANNIRAGDMRALVLHEVGVHHGFESMLGKRGFREVLRQIDRMVEEDHPAMVEARGYAERYSAHEGQVPEETLAYLIEMHADLPLVNRVLSRIRQWLIKTFGSTFGMRLTVDDLRALAITSLRRVAEQARRESADIVPIAVDPRYSQRPDAGQSGAGSSVGFPREPARSGNILPPSPLDDMLRRLNIDPTRIPFENRKAMEYMIRTYGGDTPEGRLWLDRYLMNTRDRYGGGEMATFTLPEGQRPPAALESPVIEGELASPLPDGGSAGAGSATYEELLQAAMNAPRADMERLAEIERRLAEIDAEGLISERPNASDGGDFPLFSRRGESGQNGENLLGDANARARRNPLEAPDYQARVGRVQEALDGNDAGRAGGKARGQDNLAPVKDGDKPDRELAEQARQVLAVSGIRIARIENPLMGTLRVTVDAPVKMPARLQDALQENPDARTYNTGIDFDVVEGGKNTADPSAPEGRRDGLYLRWTSVPDALRKSGVGSWMYRQLIDWAHRRGLTVYSDASITDKAWAMYEHRLPDYGYEVVKISPTTFDAVTKTHEAVNLTDPIWAIRQSYAEKPFDRAPIPRDDYQIDGPAVHQEEQARIAEQRARQAEYDKAKPHEIVLKDDPDMMFSFGPGRKIKASEAIEMSEAAQREAAAKKRAFEAAARCAIRHGGAMTARDAFLSAQAQAISTGQILGLTASIPAAWAASHMVARNADPERYALNRARIARDAMVAAQARFGEAGYQAGRRAGLDAPTTYDTPEGEPLWDNVDMSQRAGDGDLSDDDTPWQEGPRELTNQGLEEGPWDDPNAFSAQGGARTREGAHVSPAPTGVGEWDTYDITRDLARLLDPAIEPPVEDEE